MICAYTCLFFQASASWDSTLRLWDTQSGNLLHVLEGHTGWVQVNTVLALLQINIVLENERTRESSHVTKFGPAFHGLIKQQVMSTQIQLCKNRIYFQ